jgi:putative NIF3 family GTP cyclohydrolase 1 type 2
MSVCSPECGAAVTDVLTALDITSDVIEEAIDCGAQLIVSHHPADLRSGQARHG